MKSERKAKQVFCEMSKGLSVIAFSSYYKTERIVIPRPARDAIFVPGKSKSSA